MDRRGFFGSLLGLVGLGGAVAVSEVESRPLSLNRQPVGHWHQDWVERVRCELHLRGLDTFTEPNPDHTWSEFYQQAGDQLEQTGMVLIWTVPNTYKQITELYVLPTAAAVPQPVLLPDYPDGYYRIQPTHPYSVPNTVGARIPAQWIVRIKAPYDNQRYKGYSPLTMLRLHVDEAEALDRSRWYSMRYCIKPSALSKF